MPLKAKVGVKTYNYLELRWREISALTHYKEKKDMVKNIEVVRGILI